MSEKTDVGLSSAKFTADTLWVSGICGVEETSGGFPIDVNETVYNFFHTS